MNDIDDGADNCSPGLSDVRDDRFIRKYTPLVGKVVRSLGFYNYYADFEGMEAQDAMQAGFIGLWLAKQDFDPSKSYHGVKDPFLFYAKHRIRFYILDEIRRCGWVPGKRTRIRTQPIVLMDGMNVVNEEEASLEVLGLACNVAQWMRWGDAHLTDIQYTQLRLIDDCDVERDIYEMECVECIAGAVNLMGERERQFFQAVMRHDGHGNAAPGPQYCKLEGLDYHAAHHLRTGIRDRLRATLH